MTASARPFTDDRSRSPKGLGLQWFLYATRREFARAAYPAQSRHADLNPVRRLSCFGLDLFQRINFRLDGVARNLDSCLHIGKLFFLLSEIESFNRFVERVDDPLHGELCHVRTGRR